MRVPQKLLVLMLSALLLGVAPAPVSAATTISGAVVALPIRQYSGDNAIYRLAGNKATYLATFGGGNSDALITPTGGCAIKSGLVSCYGLPGTVGDGTNRSRPLAVRVPLPAGAQAVKIATVLERGGYLQTNEGDFEYGATRQLCAQGTAGVYCWGRNVNQTSLSPVTVFTGTPRIFTGKFLQDTNGVIYHWQPSDFLNPEDDFALTKIANSVEGYSVEQVTGLFSSVSDTYSSSTHAPGDLSVTDTGGGGNSDERRRMEVGGTFGTCISAVGELRCLLSANPSSMLPEVQEELFLNDTPAPLTDPLAFPGTVIQESDLPFCQYAAEIISCTTTAASGENSIGSVGEFYTADGVVRVFRPNNLQPLFTLPTGSSSPVVSYDPTSGGRFACAIHATYGVVCVNPTVGDANNNWARLPSDVDGNGLITLGREFGLDCGVGFNCAFTPTKLRVTEGIVTAVGTLVRSPRTSVRLTGTIRYSDGLPFTGQIGWISSDSKLSAESTVSSNGAFSLAARSGMGTINLSQNQGELPATCFDGTTTAGCVTQTSTAIYVDSLSSSNSVSIVVPTYQGQMRTIDLRFGDGETPISGVKISAPSSEQECSSTAVALGRMYSCASFGTSYEGLQVGDLGTISLWMPTGMDTVLTLSASDEYGLSWTEEIGSAADDGPTPDPYIFAGLIFAQPAGALSVRQGSAGTVAAMVSVDGIDPAYGLSAGIKPATASEKTCTSERLTGDTDEGGLVDFSVCPMGTQLWRVYSTDGSFFPSAAFPITIDPALTGLQVSGATLDTPFSGGTTEYSGRFRSSRVTFTATKASWARGATVTASSCSRPSRGTKVCTVKVKVGSATMTYTFTFRR